MSVPEHFQESPVSHPEGLVLVIGSAGVDIVGRTSSDLQPGTSNPANIRSSFGGVARNVAENLARLGQPVKLLTAIGDDEPGDQLLRQAKSTGINVEDILIVHEQPTSTYLAVIDSEGTLQFALDDMRTIRSVTPAYIRKNVKWFARASIIFVDSNLSKESLRTVFSLAYKAGVPVCADPTAVGLAQRLIPYLPRLHLVTPNSAEASVLCGWSIQVSDMKQATDAAKCLVSQGVDIAIITLAEFGVCYATSEMNGHIPALRTEILDPTGAGDALTATVIFALINQIPLDDAVRLGVSAASFTLSSPGTVAHDLSLEKLYDRLII